MARAWHRSAIRIPPSVLWGTLGSFAAVQGLAILGARRALGVALPATALGAQGTEVSLFEFLAYFAVATALLLLLIRYVRVRGLVTGLFFLAIGIGVLTYVELFLAPPVAIALTIVTIACAFTWIAATDVAVILGLAGIAVSFGTSAPPRTFLGLLAVLSLYDMIAVYRTRHMVAIARALVREGASFAVMVPSRLAALRTRRVDAVPGKEFFFLGTGDLALPAIFLASVALGSLPRAFAAAAGSLAGAALMLILFFGQRSRAPMPALPPIAAGTALGYLLGVFFL